MLNKLIGIKRMPKVWVNYSSLISGISSLISKPLTVYAQDVSSLLDLHLRSLIMHCDHLTYTELMHGVLGANFDDKVKKNN